VPSFRSARVARHSPQQMFDLVADTDKYPEFLPFCASMKTRPRGQDAEGNAIVLAEMEIGYKAIRERFVTRNTLDRKALRITVEYVDGPFSRLRNIWQFVAVPEGLLVELGSLYAGETRRLVITFDVPAIAGLGLAEIASLEFSYVALPALEQHTVTVPLHVNVVPGDQAAGRIPDPSVRTEVGFQGAQRAKREASAAMSAGDSRSADRSLRRAQQLLSEACAAAPAPMAAELAEDLAVVARLQQEMDSGQLARAAKFSSADAAAKSRTRGRDRRSA